MTDRSHGVAPDRVREAALERAYASLERRDTPLKWTALGIALLLHVVVLLLHLPEIKRAPAPKQSEQVLVVRRYVPPPPPIEIAELTSRIPALTKLALP